MEDINRELSFQLRQYNSNNDKFNVFYEEFIYWKIDIEEKRVPDKIYVIVLLFVYTPASLSSISYIQNGNTTILFILNILLLYIIIIYTILYIRLNSVYLDKNLINHFKKINYIKSIKISIERELNNIHNHTQLLNNLKEFNKFVNSTRNITLQKYITIINIYESQLNYYTRNNVIICIILTFVISIYTTILWIKNRNINESITKYLGIIIYLWVVTCFPPIFSLITYSDNNVKEFILNYCDFNINDILLLPLTPFLSLILIINPHINFIWWKKDSHT